MAATRRPPIKVDFIPYQLSLLSEYWIELSSTAHKKELGVTVRDLRILRLVYNQPGINLGQLVVTSVLEKSLLSKLITALVRKNLIRRELDLQEARLLA